jgi:hypothetical protein
MSFFGKNEMKIRKNISFSRKANTRILETIRQFAESMRWFVKSGCVVIKEKPGGNIRVLKDLSYR